ncbi:hypothetical protein CcCBS67573_g02444 [Chytriomyces confervae]|uniref:Protein ARV n=1 Tax=Chytriomyces confervae TaxID=246404 RepID=A0A507FIT3_9FUNG|nr:hypothetical protein CcCBS67573_g02444 [Chytriomyces confervae]
MDEVEPKRSYRCIHCAAPIRALFREYSKGNIRLEQCGVCKKGFADQYIENDPIVVFIDMVLLKKPVFRHLIHNRLSYDSRGFNGTVAKLALILVLFEVYVKWFKLEKLYGRSDFLLVESLHYQYFCILCLCVVGKKARISVFVFLDLLLLSVSKEFVIWHLSIRSAVWMLYKPESRETRKLDWYNKLSMSLIISSYGKLFLLLMAIWDYNELEYAWTLNVFVVLSNLEALSAFLDTGYVATSALIFTGVVARLFAGMFWCSSASFKTESHDKLSDASSYTPMLKKSSDTNASFLGLYPYSDAGGLDALLPAMHPANLYDPFLFGQDYLCGGSSNDGWIAQSGFSSFDGLFPPAADEVFRRDWKCSQDAFEDSVAESYLVFSSPSKPQSHVDGEADLCFEDENTASLTFPDTSVLLQVMDRECRDGNFCDAAALSQDTDDDCTPPTTEPCSRIISPLMFMHTTHTGRRDDACMSPPPAAVHGSSIHEAAQQQQQQQQASWPLAKKAVAKPYENLDDILPYIPWQELDVYRGTLPSMIPSKLANVPKQIVEEERAVVAPKCTEVETRGDNINNAEKPSKHRKKAGRKSISFNYEDFGDAIVICSVCQKPYGSQNGLR